MWYFGWWLPHTVLRKNPAVISHQFTDRVSSPTLKCTSKKDLFLTSFSLSIFSITYFRPTPITPTCRNHYLHNTFPETYYMSIVFSFLSRTQNIRGSKFSVSSDRRLSLRKKGVHDRSWPSASFPSLCARHPHFLCYYTSRHIVIAITFTILNMTIIILIYFLTYSLAYFVSSDLILVSLFSFNLLFIRLLHANLYFFGYVTERSISEDIQGVPGGMDKTTGECSLCCTIPIQPKTPISKVERLRR